MKYPQTIRETLYDLLDLTEQQIKDIADSETETAIRVFCAKYLLATACEYKQK